MNRKYCGQSDILEKQVAIKWLSSLGWSHIPEGEQYSKYDLKFQKQDKCLKVELEYRPDFTQFVDEHGWYQFKYSTIHVPARKHKSEADLYIIFNGDRSQILLLRMSDIHSSPIIKIKLKRGDSLPEENFFDVSLNTNRWEVIKIVQ